MADTDWDSFADTDHVAAGDTLVVVRAGVPYNVQGVSFATRNTDGSVSLSGSAPAATIELLQLANIGGGDNTAAAAGFYAAGTRYAGISGGYTGEASLRFDIAGAVRLSLKNASVAPGLDNAQTFGTASLRWSTLYSGTGSINTSDARDKTWRGALTEPEMAAAIAIAEQIGVFQFNESVAAKGDAARWHVGVKAQQVAATLTAHDLDPMRYGIVCFDTWEATPAVGEVRDEAGHVLVTAQDEQPAGDRYGIRYDELAMFLLAAQAQRLATIDARIASLEAA